MANEFDIDNEVEHRLKWNWLVKWRMISMLNKTIDLAENSLKDDARFLQGAKDEKNRQQEYMNTANDEEKRAKHEFMYKKQCELEMIFNLIGFVDINSIDICLLSQKMIKAKSKWSRNLYARYAYMLMYELTEDVTQFLNKKTKKEVEQICCIRQIVDTMKDQGLESELNKTSAVWNSFWNKIGTKGRNYSRIRNTSTAHRDHDFLEQYQTMTTISWGSAFEDISEFNIMYTILRGFLHVFMIKYSEKYNHDVEMLLKKH